jgi:3-oxoacyl-[acyl-carrier protein] reductase
LGTALCRIFAENGATVGGLYRHRPAPDCSTFSSSVDFTRMESIAGAIRSMEDKLGGIDILINNAGITCDGLLPGLSEAEIQEVLAVNLTGTLMACRAVLPGLISRRGGCILTVSSLAALHPQAGQAVYAASKGGIESMTRALAVELAPRHIRVNALAPGFLDSGLLRGMKPVQQESILKKIPAGRWGTLEETAEAAAFLCSDAAAYITGQIFHVDGGMGM